MSLIPTHLQARRRSNIYRSIFSVSLRIWVATLKIQGCLRRKKASWRLVVMGCVSIILYIWLSVNSLSSPVNGSSEGRWPMANVGVHSYIITKGLPVAISISSEIPFSVVLWLRIIFFNKFSDKVAKEIRRQIKWLNVVYYYYNLLNNNDYESC